MIIINYISKYNISDYKSYSNFCFINKKIFYNFEKDTVNLELKMEFKLTDVKVVKIWYKPVNTNRFILKHFGN